MFYSFKDCVITFENKSILAQEVEFSTQADVIPVYNIASPFNSHYSANFGLRGTAKFSYYLTGEDPLKRYILLEGNDPISGNIGGLHFRSGYLRTYQANLSPNEPVTINAELIFFDKIRGEFTANPSPTPYNNLPIMHLTDATINTSASTQALGNITNISYSFTNDIKSNFYVNDEDGLQNISPDRIFFGIKESRIEITSDSLIGDLPLYGKATVGAVVTLATPDGSATETLTCSGQLLAKTISSAINQPIKNIYSIVTNDLKETLKFISNNPNQGYFGDTVHIYGEGCALADVVYFGDTKVIRSSEASPVEILSDGEIRVRVPVNAITAPIRIRTIHGNIISSEENFTVLVENPRITKIPPTGQDGYIQKDYVIGITGENFYRPSRVQFGSAAASFYHSFEDKNVIWAQAPIGAQNSYITVYEDDYGLSATSSDKIYFPPVVTGLSVYSGVPGDTVAVYGRNFTDVSGAYFYDTFHEKELAASFSIVNDNRVDMIVPYGNVMDADVVLYNPHGLAGRLQTSFDPAVAITGLFPMTGVTGQYVYISGKNFQHDLLYQVGENGTGPLYEVTFGGGATGAFNTLLNGILFYGLIPTGAETGPIRIKTNSSRGAFVNENLVFTVVKTPIVGATYTRKEIGDFGVFSGHPINGTIEGNNFGSVDRIRFSGTAGDGINEVFDVTAPFFTIDKAGKKIILKNFYTEGLRTGDYDIFIVNQAGTGRSHANSGLSIFPKNNWVRASTATLSSRLHASLHGPEKSKDGITYGTLDNYGTSISAETLRPSITYTFAIDEEIRGWEVYASQDSNKAYLTDFEVTIKNSQGQTVYRDWVYPNGPTYPDAPTFRFSTGISRVTGRSLTIQRSGALNTYLVVAETIAW